MDARHAETVEVTRLRRITERPAEWVAAAPNPVLNVGLASAWIGFLWSIGFFGTSEAGLATELSTLDQFALAMFLATLGGLIAVVAYALVNSPRTAGVSAVCAISMVTIGTLCGFVGHPISAWGPSTFFAGAIGAASLAIAARRAPAS